MTREEPDRDSEDRRVQHTAREYIRAVDNHEAALESFLADLAEDYYEPGYLDDTEWDTLKRMLGSDEFGKDDVLMIIEIAAYRKAATELDREDEFDDEWPAKEGGPHSGFDVDE